MRLAALHTGSDFYLLDHIAPLAHLMQMPLFIEDEKSFTLSSHYYPMTKPHHIPDPERSLRYFAHAFDALFQCSGSACFLKQIFRDFHRKEMLLICCAHGQSDKGFVFPSLRHYSTHDKVLIYGDLFKDMLASMNIPANSILTGNYRLSFYLQNKQFFDAIADKEVFSKFARNQKALLYAPTWNDDDSPTSFFKKGKAIFSQIPEDWNLLVKIHPRLEQGNPEQYYSIAALLEGSPNKLLVSDFPLVYPLLARSDVFLGDYSSVGYDFLFFQKPMFFLPTPGTPAARLHSCGTVLQSPNFSFAEIEKNHDFTERQRKLYAYAFGESRTDESVRKLIHTSIAASGQNKNSF